MGIGQLLTMPLFFASNAIYPLAIMPPWFHVVARVNPLSYQVDVLRALMIPSGEKLCSASALISLCSSRARPSSWAIAASIYPRVVT